ncbi:MAG: hypothetical protein QOH93_644 [Chloroflexia bacterium]|jgi:hypothetical protein|nr:hypothetical protein [Chloroflexia bacterium]
MTEQDWIFGCTLSLAVALALVAAVAAFVERRRRYGQSAPSDAAEGGAEINATEQPPRQQAVRLTSGPGEMPVVPVRPLDPVVALEQRNRLAEKQGGQHLVEADRAYTEPEVAWALTQWLAQERQAERKRRHGW